MGRSGFHGGYGKMQNLQAGVDSVTTTETSFSFDETMKNSPAVVVEEFSDTNVWVSSRTNSGFTIKKATTKASPAVTFGWIAMDDSENF